jgi:single-strand DNA-binding protein
MTDSITITGFVATPPRHVVTEAGLKITSFRLASNQRRFDRQQNQWVDGETNWYTVSSFRQLAENTASSVKKGERVIVTGRVRVRDWTGEQKSGTTIEVEADALGHDLTWGQSTFARRITESGRDEGPANDQAPSDPDGFPGVEEEAAEHSEPLAAAAPF